MRALDAYVYRAALWRKNEQLFVCFGPPNKGSPACKHRMSKWVVEAISLAYESAGQPSPMAVRSHSTRSMASLKPLYQELLSKRFVMRQVGPHRTHSSDFILWTWTLPQVPKWSRSSAAFYISHRAGTRRYGGVILTFPQHQNRRNVSSPERECSGYDCNLGSLKREQMLRPLPYLLRACRRLAQVRDVARFDVPLHLGLISHVLQYISRKAFP